MCSYAKFGNGQCKYSRNIVLYGDTLSYPYNPPNITRVFVDQYGFLYPDMLLNDDVISKNCGRIRQLLLSDWKILETVSEKYHVPAQQDKDRQIDAIKLAIARDITKKINLQAGRYKRTDILIHGFRKVFYGQSDGSTSAQDNLKLEEALSMSTEDSIQFIEVYWDSKYRTRSLKDGGIKSGLRLFEDAAIPSAYAAGLSLRRVLSGISRQHLNIITHSLGALVASEILFNAGQLPDEMHTPGLTQKDIRLCMIAPAVGSELFSQYYSRSSSRQNLPDRYRIFIAYNENDFVLTKRFKWHGIGKTYTAIKFGNTSLGCDYNGDIAKFRNWISIPPYPICVDFSKHTGFAHHINKYVQNPAFQQALDFLQ